MEEVQLLEDWSTRVQKGNSENGNENPSRQVREPDQVAESLHDTQWLPPEPAIKFNTQKNTYKVQGEDVEYVMINGIEGPVEVVYKHPSKFKNFIHENSKEIKHATFLLLLSAVIIFVLVFLLNAEPNI